VITFFEDLPGWCFELVDAPEGLYGIEAYDLTGQHNLAAQGTDMEALIADLRARVSQVIAAARPPRKV
jgi:hypothetical protein